MTDTNKDGRIDMKEFHSMLYAEDIAQMAAANQSDDEDIQIVEEVSNESDNEDEEIKAEIRAGMLANREKVMGSKQEQKQTNQKNEPQSIAKMISKQPKPSAASAASKAAKREDSIEEEIDVPASTNPMIKR